MSIVNDARFALRQMGKRPGFTAVAVLTLALGIGATTAIFSVVDAVLLRPLPYPEADRVVMVWESNPSRGLPYMVASPANFADWRAETVANGTGARAVFDAMGVYRSADLTLAGHDGAERVSGGRVSAGLLRMLGVEPVLGRLFEESDDRPGAPRVAVLGYGLWQSRYAGSPDTLGRTLTIDGEPHTIIGIMPRGFTLAPPDAQDESAVPAAESRLWVPLAIDYANPASRGAHYLIALARLRPGVGLEGAEAAMDAVAADLAAEYPGTNDGWTTTLVPFREQVVGDVRPALLVLLGAVGFVLLLACANVANLQLARSVTRQREMAVRASLGADGGRLVRQLITEGVLLALLGGAAALLLVTWLVPVLVSLAPAGVPRLEAVGVNGRVALFALAACTGCGVLFSLAPAALLARRPLNDRLRDRSGRPDGPGGRRIQGALVIAEVALSLALLVAAGLLTRSFLHLRGVEPGFEVERVLTFQLSLPVARYSVDQRVPFLDGMLRELDTLPAVRAAGFTDSVPIAADQQGTSVAIEGRAPPVPGEDLPVNFTYVSPDYFRALGIPLLRGRAFGVADDPEAPGVAIVNEAFARRYLEATDPLGRRITLGMNPQTPRTIVGVVPDIRQHGLARDATPTVYLPYRQLPASRNVTFAVQVVTDPAAIVGPVREIVRRRDPALALYGVRALGEIVEQSVAQPRFSMLLLGALGAIAAILAAAGLYGVLSHAVGQRTGEIGVRMALGARAADVTWLVLRQGGTLIGAGLAAGIGLSLLLVGLLAGLLYGVSTTDPFTFAGVAAALAGVGLLASYIPARRAAQLDPMRTLREE